MKTCNNSRSPSALPRARHTARRLLACGAAVLMLPMLAALGCNKEQAPQTLVSVQAEHPAYAPIAEHIDTDAVLFPVAQAAIVPKITAPVEKFYVQRGSKVH